MIKLNSLVSSLEDYRDKAQEALEECEEKLTAIEDSAQNKGRDLNSTDNDRVADLNLESSDLQDEIDALEYAISDLDQFCD